MSAELSVEEVRKYQYIPFKVEREEWARYQLPQDNTIIKVKNVLINVKTNASLIETLSKRQETKKKEPIHMLVQIRNVTGAETSPELRGTPDNKTYSPSELADSVVQEDLEFERIQPVTTWVSKYKLEDKIPLKIQNTLLHVDRTSKYDNTGEPIYLVTSTANIKIVIPKQYQFTPKIKPSVKRVQ